jgi:hypothetical protein
MYPLTPPPLPEKASVDPRSVGRSANNDILDILNRVLGAIAGSLAIVGPFLPVIRIPFLEPFNYLNMATLVGMGPSIPWLAIALTVVGIGVGVIVLSVSGRCRVLLIPSVVLCGILSLTAYRFFVAIHASECHLDVGFGLLAIAVALMFTAATIPTKRAKMPQDAFPP